MLTNRRGFIGALLWLVPLSGTQTLASDYEFDRKINRATLESYLSRSITMLDLLTGHGNVDDNEDMR